MRIVFVVIGIFLALAVAAAAEEGDAPQADFTPRDVPESLTPVLEKLDDLGEPHNELRKCFYLFYLCAVNDDIDQAAELVSEKFYDLEQRRYLTVEDWRAQEDPDIVNPNEGFADKEKAQLIEHQLRFLSIDYHDGSDTSALQEELFGAFDVEPTDYVLHVRFYEEDDGVYLVLRLLDDKWTLVAGGSTE